MTANELNLSTDALAVVEKYEAFVSYLYPILQRSPRRHGVLRDAVLAALFVPIGDLYHAARSRQVSRLYAVDAQFATLRAYLRFLVRADVKIVTPHQHQVALMRLAEPGRVLGAWQKKLARGPGHPTRPAASLDQSGAATRSMQGHPAQSRRDFAGTPGQTGQR